MLIETLLCYLTTFGKKYDCFLRNLSRSTLTLLNTKGSTLSIQLQPTQLYQQPNIYAKYVLRLIRSNIPLI